MYTKAAIISSILAASVRAQLAGTLTRETHPSLPAQVCTKSGGCKTVNTAVTLDSNWRWTHTTSGTNCYTGNKWDAPCSGDGKACAAACAIDGADYAGTYGITTSGNALNLKFVTKGQGTNIGSRVYLMASETKYQMFKLLNQEFTFDVDASQLGCGLNGALYFIEMDEDGGMAKYTGNKAGAKYGTGYCDAQCPHDIKFIAGEANNVGWKSSATDANGGGGKYGTCCAEMDIWEANSISTAFTPHPCRDTGLFRCEGTECGDGDDRYKGVCDKDGCDFNAYRMGNTSFYGPGKIVDSTKKVTVVTQFITTDGTANGDLKEIRRKYVQNGRVIENSVNQIPGIPEVNHIDQNFCDISKTVFDDNNHFTKLGGQKEMGAAMKRGMVLALSLWADHAVHMLWLDATYPVGSTKLGAARGTCSATSGDPKDIERDAPNSAVTYSNIRWGDLDSTYTGDGTQQPPVSSSSSARPTSTSVRSSSTSASASATPSSPAGTVQKWGQCGGIGYNGPTTCVAGSTCNKINDWYSQCL